MSVLRWPVMCVRLLRDITCIEGDVCICSSYDCHIGCAGHTLRLKHLCYYLICYELRDPFARWMRFNAIAIRHTKEVHSSKPLLTGPY